MKFNTLLLIGTILLAGTNTVSAKKVKKQSTVAATSSAASINPTPTPTGGSPNVLQGIKGFLKKESTGIIKDTLSNLNSKMNPSPSVSAVASGTAPTPTPIADAVVTTQQPSVPPKVTRAIKRSVAKLLKFLA